MLRLCRGLEEAEAWAVGIVLHYGEPLVDGSAELGPLEEEEDGLWLGKVKVGLAVTDDTLAAEDAATDAGFWANNVPEREKRETVRIKHITTLQSNQSDY